MRARRFPPQRPEARWPDGSKRIVEMNIVRFCGFAHPGEGEEPEHRYVRLEYWGGVVVYEGNRKGVRATMTVRKARVNLSAVRSKGGRRSRPRRNLVRSHLTLKAARCLSD